MNYIKWLHDFFEINKADLTGGYFGSITTGQAILKTFGEIEVMEDVLYAYTEKGFSDSGNNIQHPCKLNNFEYAMTIPQKSRARIKKGWLRLYAIRLATNCYLVTGGAIKLTQDMRKEHLQNELRKLDQAKIFLLENGIDYPED